MIQSDDEPGRRLRNSPWRPASATRWAETLLIWSLVALGGAGLWLSAADPIFGGQDLMPAALTLFAFFVLFGVAATLLIWRWPALWKRWFQTVPSEGAWQLKAASTVLHLAFWVLAVFAIIGLVAFRWSPVTVGVAGGCLALGRLAVDICLHPWLGKKE
jgi:hypothetical protein